jgi:hypothetical protein
MSSFNLAPFTNRPGPINYCNSRFAKCNINKKTNFSSGNITIQGTSNALRFSSIINTYGRGAKPTFVTRQINQYGSVAGGPGGFGSSPSNHF